MSEQIVKQCDDRMKKSVAAVQADLSAQRTGRANPAILDNIKVDYYGVLTPLKQVGNISVPEPRQIIIIPWDKTICGAIEKAILEANIGLTPISDGGKVRLPIPDLNEERRKEIVKQCKKIAEEGKVSVRTIRREENEAIKKLEKERGLSEDDSHRFQERIQKLTDAYCKQVDDILVKKEKEIMEI